MKLTSPVHLQEVMKNHSKLPISKVYRLRRGHLLIADLTCYMLLPSEVLCALFSKWRPKFQAEKESHNPEHRHKEQFLPAL
jgi:hypothetical protein